MSGAEPPQYRVAALHRALAEDPRTAELGVRVRVRGDAVVLSGDVTCERRRAEIGDVVHELAPDLAVVNDIRVTEVGGPTRSEDIR